MKITPLIITIITLSIVSLLLFFNWGTIFVKAQEAFYSIYYKGATGQVRSHIETLSFRSKALGDIQRDVLVYVPNVYDTNKTSRLPTLYLLHGYPGSNNDWIINANIQVTLDALIASGKLPPVIVIFPDGNGPIVNDSQYLNATVVNQAMETHFTNELIPFIDNAYRTKKNREARAIGGISSGAYGAMNLALRNNELFGFAMSHSGYFINREGVRPQLLGNDKKMIEENNPLDYMKKKTINPKTYVYFDIGKDDSKQFIADNTAFNMLLNQKKVSHTFNIMSGWHNWNVWASNIVSSLQMYGMYLKKYN